MTNVRKRPARRAAPGLCEGKEAERSAAAGQQAAAGPEGCPEVTGMFPHTPVLLVWNAGHDSAWQPYAATRRTMQPRISVS